MKLVNQELNTARNSVIKANEENKQARKHEFSQL
jgi:hypothetical protein